MSLTKMERSEAQSLTRLHVGLNKRRALLVCVTTKTVSTFGRAYAWNEQEVTTYKQFVGYCNTRVGYYNKRHDSDLDGARP